MLQSKEKNIEQQKALMISVRFFSNKVNSILERNLIVDQKADIAETLAYLEDSLGRSTSLPTRSSLCFVSRNMHA